MEKYRKSGEGEKRQRRGKQNGTNKKFERKKLSKRKVMKEKRKNVERKKVKKKRTEKTQMIFFGADFFRGKKV